MARLRPRVTFPSSSAKVLSATGGTPDNYAAQVVKYIPAEAITAYQAVLGALSLAPQAERLMWINWTARGCLLFSFAWTLFGAKDDNEPLAWTQAIVATIGFVVWLIAIESPAIQQYVHLTAAGRSVVLILSTILFLPLLGRVLHRFLGN